MNAIVYGWTRQDFVDTMALVTQKDLRNDKIEEQDYGNKSVDESRFHSPQFADRVNVHITGSTENEMLTDTEAWSALASSSSSHYSFIN